MGLVKQPLVMRNRRMRGTLFALMVISILSFAQRAAAHPVPFSYLDIRIQSGAIELTLVKCPRRPVERVECRDVPIVRFGQDVALLGQRLHRRSE